MFPLLTVPARPNPQINWPKTNNHYASREQFFPGRMVYYSLLLENKYRKMKNQLSITSRILTAFASGALIAVFFLPAWRIDLFAPQYPEGLSMFIWINRLSGQVDIINGLNHYIGMKHITAGMFPEFSVLPYIVGFFMALGMLVAITGKRKLLLYY